MLDTGSQLYRAILERPFDDAPRLVYADWLDEHGDAMRARFIREQVRDQGRVGAAPHPIWHRGRLAALADTDVWAWAIRRVSVPSLVWAYNTGDTRVEWFRGLAGGCRTPIGEFRSAAARLFARHPVTDVDLSIQYTQWTADGAWRFDSHWRGRAAMAMTGMAAKAFGTCEEARAFVGRALVNYGRKRADLDPIPDDQWPRPTPPPAKTTSPSPSSTGSSRIRTPPSLTPT